MMGIIKLDSPVSHMGKLCENRPIASLPIAGRYRLIDFALSNMVNAGITNVGILLCDKARSVFDHLRSGKDWDLARHREGMYYMPNDSKDGLAPIGNLSGLYNNLDFIGHSSGEYVLLSNADAIFNIDYNDVLEYHLKTGADITVVYCESSEDHEGYSTVVKVADSGLVKDIARQPKTTAGTDCVMDVFLMEKETFVNLIKDAFEHGGTDFILDGIIRRKDEYTTYAYLHKGYAYRVNSVESYYKASMEMAQPDVWEELFLSGNTIHTQRKDAVPVQLKEGAQVRGSLVANGCEIYGTVENSVLFRGVKIGKGAYVKNSIIMQHGVVGEGSVLENVISDKDVCISAGKELKGDGKYPFIISKGTKI